MPSYNQIIICYKQGFTVHKSQGEIFEPLRLVQGGHTDISILQFSHHLSLIATGTTNGCIGVWDFQSSTLLAYLNNHTDFVTHIQFIEPRPLLLSSSKDGKICLWTTRPVPSPHVYICVHSFQNTIDEPKEGSVSQISSCILVPNAEFTIHPTKKLERSQILPAEIYRDYKTSYVLAKHESQVLHKDPGGSFRRPNELIEARNALIKEYNQKVEFSNKTRLD